jgi:hypothetical protein
LLTPRKSLLQEGTALNLPSAYVNFNFTELEGGGTQKQETCTNGAHPTPNQEPLAEKDYHLMI